MRRILSSLGGILSVGREENAAMTVSMAERFLIVPKTRSVARCFSEVWSRRLLRIEAA
jgi:hypothetical protein